MSPKFRLCPCHFHNVVGGVTTEPTLGLTIIISQKNVVAALCSYNVQKKSRNQLIFRAVSTV